MGGQSCPSDEFRPHRRSGDDIELLSFKTAQLFLVDEDESVPMQCGNFKLILTKQLHSPLAALLAIVKDVEWPVGIDCPVIKLGRGCYSFCLPGILYGLVLDSDSLNSEPLNQLDLFLMQYSTFEDHSKDDNVTVQGASDDEGSKDFWNDVAMKVEVICERLAWSDLHHGQGHEHKVYKKQSSSSGGGSGDIQISPRMMKRVQQARRLSAIAKLFSRALVKGAISNSRHVTNNNNLRAKSSQARSQTAQETQVVASVDAFARVVEAVESPTKTLVIASCAAAGDDPQQQQKQEMIESAWTLNKSGLDLLVKAVAASTAVNMSCQKQVQNVKQLRPPLPAVYHGSSKFPGHTAGFRPIQQLRQEQEQSHAD